MATADDYARWIVANPNKRGTPEFDVVVSAYRDAQKQSSAPKETYDPSAGGSTLQVYNPFGNNFDTGINTSESIDRFLSGAGQGFNDLKNGIGQRLGMVDQAAIDEKKRLDAPLNATTAGKVGNITSKVAVALPASFVPGANTLVGAGVLGATQGFVEPTASNESVLMNTALGGLGGVGGAIAGRAIGAGYQGLKGLVEPFTAAGQQRIAGRALERFAANPNALRTVQPGPTATGAMPTLSEATGDTGIATLERSLAQQDPRVAAAFGQRAADNNAARVGVIGDLAGTAEKRAAAEAARTAASNDAYKAATNAVYTVDGKLQDLLSRPAVQQAMARAKNIAANQGRPFAFSVDSKAPFAGVGGPQSSTSNQITGQGLQDLKMAMDEMLTDPASGFAGKSGDTIKSLRGQLLGWMEDANPAFKQARTAYAEASKPINAMDVGQRLLDKTTASMRDLSGNQRLQANALSRALNDEQGLVRKATGFKGVNSLEDVLTPEQIGALNNVRNELELSANLASAANGPGSQTAKSLASENLLRQIAGPTGLPKSWVESALLRTLMRPVQFAYQGAEPDIQNAISRVLLNPEMAGNALRASATKQLPPAAQKLIPYLQVAGKQSLANASIPR